SIVPSVRYDAPACIVQPIPAYLSPLNIIAICVSSAQTVAGVSLLGANHLAHHPPAQPRRGAVPSPPVARRLRLSLPRRRGPQGSRPGGQSSPPHGVGGLRRASQRQTRNPRLPVGAGRKRNRLAGVPAGSFSSRAGR